MRRAGAVNAFPRWTLLAALNTIGLLGLAGGIVCAYEVVDPRCEYSVNPLGVDIASPRLSWKIHSTDRGVRQEAWEIEVSSHLVGLLSGEADLWRSGRVEGDHTQCIPYAGADLKSSQQVYWRMRSWREGGDVSDWSDPAMWTMGQLEEADWSGGWIEAAEESPSVLMRKAFKLEQRPRRALLHVSGLGHYELHVNGQRVGDDFLSPGWTDYADTTLYDTRDVSAFLEEGENAIGLLLGNGMYHVERAGRFAKFEGSFGRKRAILELLVEF
ncbi:MAG: hypothetical protein RL648_145, partial [Verrucomicrobiota bacterium]